MRPRLHAAALALASLAAGLAALGADLPAQDQAAAPARKKPRNVLFMIADDLGAQALGCYGNKDCKTPAIDGLARRGVRFTRAYCQFPVCGPSRAALMAGMYPQRTGVLGNGGAQRFAETMKDKPTMSGLFKQHGWHTARVSKIYHMRVPGDITKGVHGPDHAPSWTERHSFKAPEWMTKGDAVHHSLERLEFEPDKHYALGFGTAFYEVRGAGDGAEQADVQAADKAIELLRKLKDEPFFLAVGFVRPHVPLVAPARYFDPYQPGEMRLPEAVENDQADIPAMGMSKSSAKTGLTSDGKKQRVLAAYYAAVAFMDAQVARVLQALDELGLRDDTLVVFTSDHGYHLGEHDLWQKLSLHEESARIPLLISGPGIPAHTAGALAEQIDIYPTLASLAGLDVPPHVQGKSLVPALRDPAAQVRDAAYCTKRNGHLLRTEGWALLSWQDGSKELYDMAADPGQFTNLAGVEQHRPVVTRLQARLEEKLRAIGGTR